VCLQTNLRLSVAVYLPKIRVGRNVRGSLARLIHGQFGSARMNFFTSRADILARFVNEPARELNEVPHRRDL
jgi:hypothetical protein